MFLWFKHFVLIPFSVLASIATLLWFTVEILSLTVWGLITKTRKAAHEYYKLIKGPDKPEISLTAIALIAAAGFAVYYMSRKGEK